MKHWIGVIWMTVFSCAVIFAQDPVSVSKADLAIPFGSATGQLVTVGDHLIFVNSEKLNVSFALTKENIETAAIDEGVLSINTRKPVGDMQRFRFRLDDQAMMGAIVTWSKEKSVTPIESANALTESGSKVIGEYQARHKHTFRGGCNGKLVVTTERVSYESVEEIGHSRQWDLRDIKELQRPNPYEIEIRPFLGSGYDIELIGEGMASREYNKLADALATQRAPR